jgi:hypothetical protein
MAEIILSTPPSTGGGGGGGNLQTAGGVNLSTTLVAVTDVNGNVSTLRLSTILAQILSTLRITTNDQIYLDVEDGSGNNRFTISRPALGQKVALDFASNPTGSNGVVGAFRTYVDGVNLSDVMIFIEDGSIGVNVASVDPSAIFELASTTKGFLPPRMTDAQRIAISSPAEGLMIFNTTNKGVAYRDGTNWGYLSGALQNVTGSGGTQNILFASGNIVNLTLNASTTLTFSGHVVGTYIIQVTQGGGGSNTLTYPASVKWSGGTAPTLTTAVGKTDILTFYHDGTSFFGTYSLNY